MTHESNTANKQRSERIEFRLTTNEAHELVTKAILAHMTVSEFIRKSTLGNAAHNSQLERNILIDQLEELNKIGMSLSHFLRMKKEAGSHEQNRLLNESLQNLKSLSELIIKKLSE